MTRDEIRRAVKATPFEPFTIRLTSGQSYRVNHPDFVMVPPEGRIIVVYSEDERGVTHVNLTLIEALEFENGAHEHRRKSG